MNTLMNLHAETLPANVSLADAFSAYRQSHCYFCEQPIMRTNRTTTFAMTTDGIHEVAAHVNCSKAFMQEVERDEAWYDALQELEDTYGVREEVYA
jgi:hypothetical protein